MKYLTKTYSINDNNEKKHITLFSFYFKLIYPTLAYKSILSTEKYFEIIKKNVSRIYSFKI